jgi:hypothetical protein
MRQVMRYGIEFDVCPSTGGVWLDKGEVEKLVALVRDEARSAAGAPRDGDSHWTYREDDDGDDRHRGRRRSRLSDLFDF